LLVCAAVEWKRSEVFDVGATCEAGKAEEEGQRVGNSSMAKCLEGKKEAHCTTTRLIPSVRYITLPTLLYCTVLYCTTPQN
jgi:hypothetical protein